jgi:hypothetical protein
VSTPAYKDLLAAADLVVGLTKVEGIQLSVANEAVGFGKAMVLSGTKITRELFTKGAEYVGSDADSIKDGIRAALHRKVQLEAESSQLRVERIGRWASQARAVLQQLQQKKSA